MRQIGYSTGAIAKSDFVSAISFLRDINARAIELSALRLHELESLLDALDHLDLSNFEYIAFHAPSNFTSAAESKVVQALTVLRARQWPIIVHPDVIATPSLWRPFGSQICIENMDQRKPIGQSSLDLRHLFSTLPEASLCFDLAHVQQVDPTMLEATRFLQEHGDRLRQIHMSDLDSFSAHHRMSQMSLDSFATVCQQIDERIPVILESPLSEIKSNEDVGGLGGAVHEMSLARAVFGELQPMTS